MIRCCGFPLRLVYIQEWRGLSVSQWVIEDSESRSTFAGGVLRQLKHRSWKERILNYYSLFRFIFIILALCYLYISVCLNVPTEQFLDSVRTYWFVSSVEPRSSFVRSFFAFRLGEHTSKYVSFFVQFNYDIVYRYRINYLVYPSNPCLFSFVLGLVDRDW